MKPVTCIEDLRQIARRKVPRAFFEYADGGSYTEQTMDANRRDLEAIKLRQRVLVDVAERHLQTTVLGQDMSLPLALAPTGLTGMQHRDGEVLAARAAESAGIPFCLSTMSICSIEDVAAATSRPFWFQLYVMRDRGFARSLIERARKAKCSALFLTVDLPLTGQRHKDIKNGLGVPPRLTLSSILDIATKPAWTYGILRGKRRTFGNLDGWVPTTTKGSAGLAQWIGSQFDATLNWQDVEWIRDMWPGKLVLKGILDVEDARLAVKSGVDGIVVSNHGGRQLDGAPSTVSELARIADAVGTELEIIFDSGVRTGQDVMRALALGARACMIGRAFLYGLGANGEAGVASAIGIIRNELDVSMALAGVKTISQIDRRVLVDWPSNTGLR